MKKHYGCSNSYKGEHPVGAGFSFRGLVHYQHIREHNSTQTDTVLGRSWEFYAWRVSQWATGPGLSFWNLKACSGDTLPPTGTHLLILSNNTIPYEPNRSRVPSNPHRYGRTVLGHRTSAILTVWPIRRADHWFPILTVSISRPFRDQINGKKNQWQEGHD